jgi:hypothetical protein
MSRIRAVEQNHYRDSLFAAQAQHIEHEHDDEHEHERTCDLLRLPKTSQAVAFLARILLIDTFNAPTEVFLPRGAVGAPPSACAN